MYCKCALTSKDVSPERKPSGCVLSGHPAGYSRGRRRGSPPAGRALTGAAQCPPAAPSPPRRALAPSSLYPYHSPYRSSLEVSHGRHPLHPAAQRPRRRDGPRVRGPRAHRHDAQSVLVGGDDVAGRLRGARGYGLPPARPEERATPARRDSGRSAVGRISSTSALSRPCSAFAPLHESISPPHGPRRAAGAAMLRSAPARASDRAASSTLLGRCGGYMGERGCRGPRHRCPAR